MCASMRVRPDAPVAQMGIKSDKYAQFVDITTLLLLFLLL